MKIKKSMRNKELLTLGLILLLFFVIRFALVFIGTNSSGIIPAKTSICRFVYVLP